MFFWVFIPTYKPELPLVPRWPIRRKSGVRSHCSTLGFWRPFLTTSLSCHWYYSKRGDQLARRVTIEGQQTWVTQLAHWWSWCCRLAPRVMLLQKAHSTSPSCAQMTASFEFVNARLRTMPNEGRHTHDTSPDGSCFLRRCQPNVLGPPNLHEI